jgi:hypothetical protein
MPRPLHIGQRATRTEEGWDRGGPVELDADALVRHAFVCGASGGGKTVFCKGLVEEAVLAGVPVIAIDFKGDLASLALRGPLATADGLRPIFGQDADAIAAEFAAGAEATRLDPERAAAYAERSFVRVFTPNSSLGRRVALQALPSFPEPVKTPLEREERDELIQALVLGFAHAMYGTPAAVKKNEPAVKLVEELVRWCADRGETLEGAAGIARILQLVTEPPFGDMGGMSIDQYLPLRDKQRLMQKLNSRLLGAERSRYEGPRLSVETLLGDVPPGKTPLSVVYLGHSSDFAEQSAVLGQLCADIYRWMRKVGGSSGTRLLVYVDELGGGDAKQAFYPSAPHNPPSKAPLNLLVRQGRSAGIAMLLATQNPVSVDVRGLGNINTWALGRLTRKNDHARVEDLLSRLPGGMEEGVRAVSQIPQGMVLAISDALEGPQYVYGRWLYSVHRQLSPGAVGVIHSLLEPNGPEDSLASSSRNSASATSGTEPRPVAEFAAASGGNRIAAPSEASGRGPISGASRSPSGGNRIAAPSEASGRGPISGASRGRSGAGGGKHEPHYEPTPVPVTAVRPVELPVVHSSEEVEEPSREIHSLEDIEEPSVEVELEPLEDIEEPSHEVRSIRIIESPPLTAKAPSAPAPEPAPAPAPKRRRPGQAPEEPRRSRRKASQVPAAEPAPPEPAPPEPTSTKTAQQPRRFSSPQPPEVVQTAPAAEEPAPAPAEKPKRKRTRKAKEEAPAPAPAPAPEPTTQLRPPTRQTQVLPTPEDDEHTDAGPTWSFRTRSRRKDLEDEDTDQQHTAARLADQPTQAGPDRLTVMELTPEMEQALEPNEPEDEHTEVEHTAEVATQLHPTRKGRRRRELPAPAVVDEDDTGVLLADDLLPEPPAPTVRKARKPRKAPDEPNEGTSWVPTLPSHAFESLDEEEEASTLTFQLPQVPDGALPKEGRWAVKAGPREWWVGPRGLTLGRSPRADAQIVDKHVSRMHVQLQSVGTTLIVRRLNAKNPTWVDGRELGDTLRLEPRAQAISLKLGDTEVRLTWIE